MEPEMVLAGELSEAVQVVDGTSVDGAGGADNEEGEAAGTSILVDHGLELGKVHRECRRARH
jgi:hypothetical protein